MAQAEQHELGSTAVSEERRRFLRTASVLAMVGGLCGGYGMFAYLAGRFLYPSGPSPRQWMFVTEVDRMRLGDSVDYQAPAGEKIVITRQQHTGRADDFLARSSTCPHLGCQVHWQLQHQRYFCPCHNGVFDASGKGIGGPPGDAGQSLPQYALMIEQRLLFIEVPTTSVASEAHQPGGDLPSTCQACPGRVTDHVARLG